MNSSRFFSASVVDMLPVPGCGTGLFFRVVENDPSPSLSTTYALKTSSLKASFSHSPFCYSRSG